MEYSAPFPEQVGCPVGLSARRYRSNNLQIRSQYTKFKKGIPEAVGRNPCHCFQRERDLSPHRCQSKGPTPLLVLCKTPSVSSIPNEKQLLSSSYSLVLCWTGRMAGRWLPQATVARSCSYSNSFPKASISVRCQNSLDQF